MDLINIRPATQQQLFALKAALLNFQGIRELLYVSGLFSPGFKVAMAMSLPGYSKHKWSGALVDLLLGDLMVRRQSETAAAKNARLCRQNTRQGGQLHFSVVVHNWEQQSWKMLQNCFR